MACEQNTALILVDVQNDFSPGGALGVNEGDQVVIILNPWIERYIACGLPVAYTMDWHPANHCSFLGHGGTWPPHCVRETSGAELRQDLIVPATKSSDVGVFRKGFLADREAYSGFDGRLDGDISSADLGEWLRHRKVKKVYVGGLATDYCVKATVLDALKAGFEAAVILDGIRAVNVEPKDGEKSIQEMVDAGALIVKG